MLLVLKDILSLLLFVCIISKINVLTGEELIEISFNQIQPREGVYITYVEYIELQTIRKVTTIFKRQQ